MYEFIEHYFGEYRQSPLIREIQTGCQIASYKSVLDRLNALEHKGYIKRAPNKHRGIRLIRKHPVPQPKMDAPAKVDEPSLQSAGEGVAV